jgi:hypothetical protein
MACFTEEPRVQEKIPRQHGEDFGFGQHEDISFF